MLKALIFVSFAFLVHAQYRQDYNGIPNPYQFSYSSQAIGGGSSHQESGDGNGRVSGSYSVVDEDGRSRTVEYVADELGFRPNIITNEPGTSNLSPADVTVSSSADDGYGGIQTLGAPPRPIADFVPASPPVVPVQPRVQLVRVPVPY
ncbi:cuticle protein 10.9-like [Stegodyphus dumicola]|uniref:cuticle protein 10.9-like n=1 Tax=Stegodyphus dumicola TaxID=202533 RepID=UPI0015AB3CFB|nr:cuticle protein 10.9-like [Stegodyphus dumicola]